ncbi:hypothetical protein G7Z17_g2877 [Cylindrodendrum hubeiense]|uniref:Uncharacterized protein n=1 Tax=Cylindrodendrum hubeiense TaxID=595255 RepID=A0A9P5HGR5_9HYPO|nr:hypothetical protein G7Z17_g2877 [Cylindrodendrum hubeiense]
MGRCSWTWADAAGRLRARLEMLALVAAMESGVATPGRREPRGERWGNGPPPPLVPSIERAEAAIVVVYTRYTTCYSPLQHANYSINPAIPSSPSTARPTAIFRASPTTCAALGCVGRPHRVQYPASGSHICVSLSSPPLRCDSPPPRLRPQVTAPDDYAPGS